MVDEQNPDVTIPAKQNVDTSQLHAIPFGPWTSSGQPPQNVHPPHSRMQPALNPGQQYPQQQMLTQSDRYNITEN